MDAYACLIKQRGAAQAAEMLADLCRSKDTTIETLQTALRSLGGASITNEHPPCTHFSIVAGGPDAAFKQEYQPDSEEGRLP